jgi:hypothetical protein
MEYRCRQGICIPLQTTFDKVINCSDAAAEYRANTHRLGGSSVFICDILSNFFSVMNMYVVARLFLVVIEHVQYTLWTKSI